MSNLRWHLDSRGLTVRATTRNGCALCLDEILAEMPAVGADPEDADMREVLPARRCLDCGSPTCAVHVVMP